MKKLTSFLLLFLLIPTLCFGTVADSYSPEKYTGNGSTDEFSFSWTLIADSNIRVYLENISTGVQTAQTLDSDFTVSFDDDTPGGTVTFTTPPTSSYYVIISREISKTQSTPYTTSSGFRAKVVEASLDKLTAQTQDLQEQLDRSLKLPLGTSEDSITFPEPEADKVVGWNSGGTALENKDGLDEAVTAAEAAQTAAETAETNASTSATSASTSATNASTAQTAAETAQAAAEAAAAGVNLPSIGADDTDKILQVNAGETGYELNTLDTAGIVDKTTAQTIAGVKTFSSSPIVPETPTTDTQAASKGYVDAKSFGSWVDKSSNYSAQQASTDGFVVLDFYAVDSSLGIVDYIGYTDSNTNPTTKRCGATFHYSYNTSGKDSNQGFVMPVKKDDYWKVIRTSSGTISTETLTVYWIPFGN